MEEPVYGISGLIATEEMFWHVLDTISRRTPLAGTVPSLLCLQGAKSLTSSDVFR